MIVTPDGQPPGAQDPAYRPSLALFFISPTSTTPVRDFQGGGTEALLIAPYSTNAPLTGGAHVRIVLSGRDRLVPEQIANVPDVRATLEQLGRVAVPARRTTRVTTLWVIRWPAGYTG
jgi:hypothetical protein